MAFKAIGKTIKRPLFKTISNTIKKSLGTFHQNKNTIKNIAFGLQKKSLQAMHNVRSRSVKYLAEESIQKFKYIAPQTARGSKRLVNGEQLRPMVKRSAEYMRGGELGHLINLASKSTPQAPLLFGAGGLSMLTEHNLGMTSAITDFFFKKKVQVQDYLADKVIPYVPEGEIQPVSHKVSLDALWKHDFTLIWLNALGEMAPEYEVMWNSGEIMYIQGRTKIVSVTAPKAPLTINKGLPNFQWFDLKRHFSEKLDFYDMKDVRQSDGLVREIIDEELKKLGGKSEHLYIGGFGEGAAQALYTAMGYEKKLGGVVGINGFKFPETKVHESNKDIPTFVCHGTSDEIIDFRIAEKTYHMNDWHKKKNVEFVENDSEDHELVENKMVLTQFKEFIEKLNNKTLARVKLTQKQRDEPKFTGKDKNHFFNGKDKAEWVDKGKGLAPKKGSSAS